MLAEANQMSAIDPERTLKLYRDDDRPNHADEQPIADALTRQMLRQNGTAVRPPWDKETDSGAFPRA